LAGARTVSVRSTFDDESNRRIFKIPPLPSAANRDGSRSGHSLRPFQIGSPPFFLFWTKSRPRKSVDEIGRMNFPENSNSKNQVLYQFDCSGGL
jgi:hypothetical protein